MITRDITIADLPLELRTTLTQYDYLVIDRSTRLVVVSGKLSALDGKAAKKVAQRFMKQMVKRALVFHSERAISAATRTLFSSRAILARKVAPPL
jgi:hypothetical protein